MFLSASTPLCVRDHLQASCSVTRALVLAAGKSNQTLESIGFILIRVLEAARSCQFQQLETFGHTIIHSGINGTDYGQRFKVRAGALEYETGRSSSRPPALCDRHVAMCTNVHEQIHTFVRAARDEIIERIDCYCTSVDSTGLADVAVVVSAVDSLPRPFEWKHKHKVVCWLPIELAPLFCCLCRTEIFLKNFARRDPSSVVDGPDLTHDQWRRLNEPEKRQADARKARRLRPLEEQKQPIDGRGRA